jgi:hypothetical protein
VVLNLCSHVSLQRHSRLGGCLRTRTAIRRARLAYAMVLYPVAVHGWVVLSATSYMTCKLSGATCQIQLV